MYIGEGQSSSASLPTCFLALPVSLLGNFDFTVFYNDSSPEVHPTHTPLVLGRMRLSAVGTLSRGLRTLDYSAARLGRGTWMYQGLLCCSSILLLTFCLWATYAVVQRLWSQMAKARGFQEPCNRRGVLHHSITDLEAGLHSTHKVHSPIRMERTYSR